MKITATKILLIVVVCISVVAGVMVSSRYNNATPAAASGGDSSTTINIGKRPFLRWNTPRALPTISFQDEDGKKLTLADFHGRVVLLNIWATWCPPCREEMPSLDRLNSKRGGPEFEVVALSIDHDPAAVKPFYDEIGIKTLRGYFDPNARGSAPLGVFSVPATLLIGKDGREIGRALGEAEWDSATVEALIDDALASPPTTD